MKYRFRGILLLALSLFSSGCTGCPSLINNLHDLSIFTLLNKDHTEAPPETSLTARNGSALFHRSYCSILVVLDPTGSTGTDGTAVSVFRMGQHLLIETADPLNRFLPSAQIIPASPACSPDTPQHILAPQAPINYRWSMMPLDTVSLLPLKASRIGTTTAGELPAFLQAHSSSRGLNVLLPSGGFSSPGQEVFVYQTPASMTILVLTPEAADSSLNTTGVPLTVLSVLTEDIQLLGPTLLTLTPPLWLGEGIPPSGIDNGTGTGPDQAERFEFQPDDAIEEPVNSETAPEEALPQDWLQTDPEQIDPPDPGQVDTSYPEQSDPPDQEIIDPPDPEQTDPPDPGQVDTSYPMQTDPPDPGQINPPGADAPRSEILPAQAPLEAMESVYSPPGREPDNVLNAGQSSTLACLSGAMLVSSQDTISITLTCTEHPETPVSLTAPEVDPALLGSCPPEVHDRFIVIGPDGRRYRTWHPVKVLLDPAHPDGPGCTFAHEHGDRPHPDAPPPLFGYAAYHAGLDRQIADHAGYKVFTHQAGNQTGWHSPEAGPVSPDWDMMVWLHMGTSSSCRLTTRFHEVGFWSRDLEDRISEIHVLADTGDVMDGCSGHTAGPERRIASACEFSQETWAYRMDLEPWSAAFQVSVLNPMTYLAGAVQYGGAAVLQSTSENICGTGSAPCMERLPFGSAGSHWLGNQRMLRWPDWRWQNHNGEEFFCTDPFGIPLEQERCNREEHGAILQRAASLNWIGEPGQPWDRSSISGAAAGTTLPLGAPGGN